MARKKDPERKKRAYMYTRVSTWMQVDGYSLDAQREKIRRYAEYEGWDIVHEFSDEGKSGKSVEGREQFQEMMNFIGSGAEVDYVMVFKLSRFGRNTADILNSLQFMQDHGVELMCVEEKIDSGKGMGKLIITLLGALAEMERENIIAQTQAGREQKAHQGKWNGGQAPYGYKLVLGDDGDKYLEVVPEAAEHVRMIYDLYLNKDLGMARIAGWLNDRGYRKKTYKNGSLELFASSFVKGVLDNPVYAGKIAYGRRRTEKVEGTRDKYHAVKQDDYELFEGVHEAIIDEQTWMAAHAKRKETGRRNPKTHSLGHIHMLSGLLKCPVCGAGMYGNVNRKRKKDGSGEFYADNFYYCCKHRQNGATGHRCDFNRQFAQNRVDMELFELMTDLVSEDKFQEVIMEKLYGRDRSEQQRQEILGLEETKKQKERAIDSLAQQMDSLSVSDAMYERRYDDLRRRQDRLYAELADVERDLREANVKLERNGDVPTPQETMTMMLYIKEHMMDWWHRPSVEQQEFLRSIIEKIEVYPDARKRDERIIRKVTFKIPMMYDGEEVEELYFSPVRDTSPEGWDRGSRDETVALLSHQKSTRNYVTVDWEPEQRDMHHITGATYAEIKAYVKANYGLSVSALYIAQIKDECGLEKRACYNKSKKSKDEQVVPQCPPEKREAILDAFHHFGMIDQAWLKAPKQG